MDYEKLLHAMCAANDSDADGYMPMDKAMLHGWPVEVREWWCSGPRQKLWRERRQQRLEQRLAEAQEAMAKFHAEPA